MNGLRRRLLQLFSGTQRGERPQTIDVIVPVFNAFEETKACLDSLQKHTDRRHNIFIFDDASTDVRIGALLNEFHRHWSQSKVVRNPANVGFTTTVNRGMSLARNDVVLLNSDAMVTPGWLDRLLDCAASDSSIGTITPFSNNATICSFPEFCRNNPVPADPVQIAEVFERVVRPCYPDLPTAVGFCMYIRRRLLNTVGLFNAEVFGKGYGEENDFSLRARAAGYRNVLCDNAYVAHVGHSSFGKTKEHLAAQNMDRLLQLHPEYAELVDAFIANDPLSAIRSHVLRELEAMGATLADEITSPAFPTPR